MAKVYAVKMFSLEAGPQVGFKISDKIDVPEGGNEIKTVDTAFAGGLGLNFPFGLGINAQVANRSLLEPDLGVAQGVCRFLPLPKVQLVKAAHQQGRRQIVHRPE